MVNNFYAIAKYSFVDECAYSSNTYINITCLDFPTSFISDKELKSWNNNIESIIWYIFCFRECKYND